MKLATLAAIGASAAALLLANGANAATVFSNSSAEGVEFTLTEVNSSLLTLTMVGTLGGDWSTATHLYDFALNQIGTPASVTATLQPSGPSAVSTGSGGLSNSSSSAGCTLNGNFYCFNYAPSGIAVTGGGAINLTFDLVAASGSSFSFGADEPALKVFFGDNSGNKIGSLYSQDLHPGAGNVPEPATWSMMIIGAGMIGGVMRRRRKLALSMA